MTLEDTVETYKYFISEAEKLDLAYITLVRYIAGYDVEIDGQCLLISSARAEGLIELLPKVNYEQRSTTS